MSDAQFLLWIADRLVNVYGESPCVDFVLKLREIARDLPELLAIVNDLQSAHKTPYDKISDIIR